MITVHTEHVELNVLGPTTPEGVVPLPTGDSSARVSLSVTPLAGECDAPPLPLTPFPWAGKSWVQIQPNLD